MSMRMSSIFLAPSTCSSLLIITVLKRHTLTPSSFHSKQGIHGGLHFSSIIKPDNRKHSITVNSSAQPLPPPPPPPPSDPSPAGFGRGWIAGIVLAILLPFLKNKLGPLLLSIKLEDVDTVIQRVEDTVEVFEKVVDGVEKVAEEVSDELPQGRLKEAATLVERVAKEAAKDAHVTDTAFHEVQELEEKAETFMRSTSNETSKTDEAKDN